VRVWDAGRRPRNLLPSGGIPKLVDCVVLLSRWEAARHPGPRTEQWKIMGTQVGRPGTSCCLRGASRGRMLPCILCRRPGASPAGVVLLRARWWLWDGGPTGRELTRRRVRRLRLQYPAFSSRTVLRIISQACGQDGAGVGMPSAAGKLACLRGHEDEVGEERRVPPPDGQKIVKRIRGPRTVRVWGRGRRPGTRVPAGA